MLSKANVEMLQGFKAENSTFLHFIVIIIIITISSFQKVIIYYAIGLRPKVKNEIFIGVLTGLARKYSCFFLFCFFIQNFFVDSKINKLINDLIPKQTNH